MKVATINGITIQGRSLEEFLNDWDNQHTDSPVWERIFIRLVWLFMVAKEHPSASAYWQTNGDEFHVSYP
ncbi:hypothetical protein [uncultured Algoriphagus sp.]|uniref:hypothetical protein n=1 Tax=uncultured Algoriphagus sp. TaxID=417365 RepID=UPI0025926A3A|nr:hypothetical protein [uncultured Algoriphagus sp.]